jgi:hypothetical protein
MESINREDLARRLQNCMKEAGLDAQITSSKHEFTVYARTREKEGGPPVSVIAQISDRIVSPAGAGGVADHIARTHLLNAVTRPTLNARSASRSGSVPSTSESKTFAIANNEPKE